MQLSIIIVNYNTADLLRQTVQSVVDCQLTFDYEIIVVDNNSEDNSVQMIRSDFPGIRLIANSTNAGFSRANNQAAEAAAGRNLLFLNSDTIVKKNSLETMLSGLEGDQEVAVVGPKLLNEDGSLQLSCGVFPTLKTEFYLRSFLSRLFPDNRLFGSYKLAPAQYENSMVVDWLSGACLLIRRNVFEQVHGFDENIYMFYEDVDLCFNVRKQGFKVWFVATAEVYHLHGGSWLNRREIPVKNSCRSALYFFRKHYSVWQTAVLRIFLLLEIVLAHIIFIPYLLLKKEKLSGIYARLRGYYACLRCILFS